MSCFQNSPVPGRLTSSRKETVLVPRLAPVMKVLPVLFLMSAMMSAMTGAAAPQTPIPPAPVTAAEVEARVSEKINSSLGLILEQNEFRVIVAAKVRQWREKVLLEGSTEAQSKGAERSSAQPDKLPGFTGGVTPQPAAKDVNRAEKSRFEFRDRSELTSVAVQLVLARSLPQDVRDLAAKNAREMLALTAGETGKLEVIELDLAHAAADATLWGWLTDYLSKRGGSAIDLLYLALLVLGFVGLLLTLRQHFKSKKTATGSPAVARTAAEDAGQQKADEHCGKRLDELIGLLNRTPLITRMFLRDLSAADKAFLYKNLRTPAMQTVFRRILDIGPAAEDQQAVERAPVVQDARLVFDRIMAELSRFIALNQEMESRPFGYLPQLSGQQVARFIVTEQDRVRALHVLAPYLSAEQLRAVTRQVPVQEKAVFLGGLRNLHGDLLTAHHDSGRPDDGYTAQLEKRLRLVFEDARQQAVVDMSGAQSLENAFLESDPDSIAVIRQLAARYGKVPAAYEKYLVGFEEFLGLDLGIAKKVLQRVSNDVLLQALADRDLDPRIVAMIGEMRSQLLASLKKRNPVVSRQDMENARSEVLRQYRALT